MPDPEKPELIDRRRSRVLEWIKDARAAVLSFQRAGDGSFWKDTKLAIDKRHDKLSPTTTARCYMALVYADRCFKEAPDDQRWREHFRTYVSRLQIEWTYPTPTLSIKDSASKPEDLNHFEVAHIADLAFVKHFLECYAGVAPFDTPMLEDASLCGEMERHFRRLADETRESGDLERTGQLPMQGKDARHFFANLHAARAYAILGLRPSWTDVAADALRRHCVEQCFYAQRGPAHKLDTIQLILAGVTYALFDRKPSVDLIEAIIDAIHDKQLPGGNWPATHPVFLPSTPSLGEKPWHITSHEMALCLTWLYHLPAVPDGSRQKLLAMMERYFENWVVRTYVPGDHPGWYDDHHINEGYAVGWSTSIVCHFLANYYWILGHELNRVVIVTLGLEDSAEHYSFDGTAPKRARRVRSASPMWADLPPHAWDPETTVASAVTELRKHWTDPSEGQVISQQLMSKIVDPILRASGAGPGRSRSSGILNGPPGTRKTSFVGRTAEVIRWPLVTVPGSVILANGWDGMEARATEVFRYLKLLTNCVIFFDEYEEFFRAREGKAETPMGEIDNRTIAAFMTSGMLPRLQDLHDAQQCLVFLATNFPKNIDEAVRRAGRFDFNLMIPHPQSKRAIEYVEDPSTRTRKQVEQLAKRPVDALVRGVKEAIVAYAKGNGPNVEIPFKNLEDALRAAAQGYDHEAKERALRVLGRGTVMDAPTLDQLD